MSVKALRCPNCNAPLRQVMGECAYCGIPLVIDGKKVGINRIDHRKWELRQRKGLSMLPNEVRKRIQYPKETLQTVSPITRTSGRFSKKELTDFWVITNQRLIFYWSDSCLEIKFEDFLSADIISKSGRRLEIGLRISFLADDKHTYREFLLGHNPRNTEFIKGYKKSIKKYYDVWLTCK